MYPHLQAFLAWFGIPAHSLAPGLVWVGSIAIVCLLVVSGVGFVHVLLQLRVHLYRKASERDQARAEAARASMDADRADHDRKMLQMQSAAAVQKAQEANRGLDQVLAQAQAEVERLSHELKMATDNLDNLRAERNDLQVENDEARKAYSNLQDELAAAKKQITNSETFVELLQERLGAKSVRAKSSGGTPS